MGTDPRRAGFERSDIVDASGNGARRPYPACRCFAWDADHVRLMFRGPLCRRVARRARLFVERLFEADVWLPFGDAWDVQVPCASVDSPVQALYRAAFATAVGSGPGVLPASPATATPPEPRRAARGEPQGEPAGGFVCDCGCEGPAALEAAAGDRPDCDRGAREWARSRSAR